MSWGTTTGHVAAECASLSLDTEDAKTSMCHIDCLSINVHSHSQLCDKDVKHTLQRGFQFHHYTHKHNTACACEVAYTYMYLLHTTHCDINLH